MVEEATHTSSGGGREEGEMPEQAPVSPPSLPPAAFQLPSCSSDSGGFGSRLLREQLTDMERSIDMLRARAARSGLFLRSHTNGHGRGAVELGLSSPSRRILSVSFLSFSFASHG